MRWIKRFWWVIAVIFLAITFSSQLATYLRKITFLGSIMDMLQGKPKTNNTAQNQGGNVA